MQITEIISKKRNSGKLTYEEINFAVSSYTLGRLPDYQMAALLMALFIKGMDAGETAYLTKAMLHSGETIDLSGIAGNKIDKHSTGGVGDGTSLIVAPLAASVGIIVPMMAGRALGHTGGTLDKLEAIPGFNINLSKDEFIRNLKKIGLAITGQTEKIAPADKKIYALRDVTATVDSIPLIAASIMSKKLAEGCEGLVLDVKTGNGAFMQEKKSAVNLAKELVKIAKDSGKKAIALITDMNQPLGNSIGNSLEILQAIDIMKGSGPEDLKKLVIELVYRMLALTGDKDPVRAKRMLKDNLSNGMALIKFREMIELQGGNSRVVDEPEKILPRASVKYDLLSPKKGYLEYKNTKNIGIAANLLGAGRAVKEDRIDYGAGIVLNKKHGDPVEKGEPIAVLCCNNQAGLKEAEAIFFNSIKITPKKIGKQDLIIAEIK